MFWRPAVRVVMPFHFIAIPAYFRQATTVHMYKLLLYLQPSCKRDVRNQYMDKIK